MVDDIVSWLKKERLFVILSHSIALISGLTCVIGLSYCAYRLGPSFLSIIPSFLAIVFIVVGVNNTMEVIATVKMLSRLIESSEVE